MKPSQKQQEQKALDFLAKDEFVQDDCAEQEREEIEEWVEQEEDKYLSTWGNQNGGINFY